MYTVHSVWSPKEIFQSKNVNHSGSTEPRFIMRAISYHKTALERQISEAVRIRRRGGDGAVLNSKSEYNRSYIPRLVVEERNIDTKKDVEESEAVKTRLELNDRNWESSKLRERTEEHQQFMTSGQSSTNPRYKRRGDDFIGREQRTSKRRKYVLMETDWGENNLSSYSNMRQGGLSERKLNHPSNPLVSTPLRGSTGRGEEPLDPPTDREQTGRGKTGLITDYLQVSQAGDAEIVHSSLTGSVVGEKHAPAGLSGGGENKLQNRPGGTTKPELGDDDGGIGADKQEVVKQPVKCTFDKNGV